MLKDDIVAELNRMEELDVITKQHDPTDWVSSLVYTKKPNGDLRICLDPRDLNKGMKRTYHKTPTVEELTHKLSGAQVFSKLDARHGYWSIVLDEESSKLTTINSPVGRYRFKRLPFGIRVAQDIFQERMDMILEQCPGSIGIADDVLVFGRDDNDHDANLHKLMQVASQFGLVFNWDKCDIKVDKVKFFGCYYDHHGIHPDPEKVQEIHSLPAPQIVEELQQFLGIVTYMGKFIPKLADHTETLRGLLRTTSTWQWTPSHQAAFDKLKSLICTDCTLTYFDPAKETTIQVDASSCGLGAALVQDGKPVAFASKRLTETEQRYANIERESSSQWFLVAKDFTHMFSVHTLEWNRTTNHLRQYNTKT